MTVTAVGSRHHGKAGRKCFADCGRARRRALAVCWFLCLGGLLGEREPGEPDGGFPLRVVAGRGVPGPIAAVGLGWEVNSLGRAFVVDGLVDYGWGADGVGF